ncbi:MAG: hypothetical protein CME62_17975 [Halobacteriovoraceae bacterium]|nr:hypothetical protein [Halobacteriovoraceae bacterium]|tara:strand:+ start:15719 stop:18238 length:2520 start_codon:yes stop_codon:yes gene_type:complete
MDKVLLVLFLFIFISCDEQQGDFEPNNLISISEDEAAERKKALLSGNPFFQEVNLNSPKVFDVGEKIVIYGVFQKRTRITNGGVPRIPLNIGGVTRYANYVSGSESQSYTFRFEYTIQAGDLDHDGIELQSPWELNGATIEDYANKEVLVDYDVPNTSSHQVDTSDLVISFASSYVNTASANLTVAANNASTLYIGTSCLSGGSASAFATTKPVNIFNTNGTNTFYVAAGNGSGGYSQCQTATIIHDNSAPNLITGISNSNNASDIESDEATWNVGSDNGPSDIAYYEIAVSTSNTIGGIISPEGDWKNVGTDLNGSINNGSTPWLSPVTDYYTLVRATDRAGNVSGVSSSSAWQIAALSPEQITSMSVVEAGNDSIKVGWPYPDDNGFPITDYVIQYRLGTDSTWITINDGISTSRRHTLNGLSAETEYDFRVRAYNGTNYGAWSPVLVAETLPNIDFATYPYVAINIGGATKNALVSMEDGNDIYYGDNTASTYNDGSLIYTGLNQGENVSVDADDFTVVRGTKPFFIAGTLRYGGGDSNKGNIVWGTKAWIGKSFLFNHNRSNPMRVNVYAFSDSDITITSNGNPIAGGSISLTAENGHAFTINGYGSYEIASTGFIIAYSYAAGGGNQVVDPKPLLPAANDLVGVPSRDAKVSTDTNGTSATYYHSDGVNGTLNITNAGDVGNINQRGTSGLYRDEAIRIRANANIVATSYADSNGSCAAPLVPVAFQKTKFALNVRAEWVAFASTNELTVTAYEPDGVGGYTTTTFNMTRTGANNNTPTKQYSTSDFKAGTVFEGTAPFQMWYEPKSDNNSTLNTPGGENNAASRDETILFGWD